MSTKTGSYTSAKDEFPNGRVMWLENGWPCDAYKVAALGECIVLGCDKKSVAPSCFCAERHGGRQDV
jgi:hypothetical protein